MSLKSEFLSVKEGKLHIKIPITFNSKLPIILFLHGASPKSQHTEFWDPLINIITSICNPIFLDRFGHGKSEPNSSIMVGVKEQILSIIQLIDYTLEKYQILNIIIVGRSQGGAYATRIAKEIPEKIKALGLIAPGGMKTNYKNLIEWNKSVSLLWDIEDPVVKFVNYQFVKDALDKQKLFTIGSTTEHTEKSIERASIKKSHTPELMAPSLFEDFLKSIVE